MNSKAARLLALLILGAGGVRAFAGSRAGATYARIYLDAGSRVHLVTAGGADRLVTPGRRCAMARLASDGRTAGWSCSTVIHDPADRNKTYTVHESLVLYRAGRIFRKITPGGFIRDWTFRDHDSAAVIYSGGLHFGGVYAMYELASGRILARGEDPVTAQSPDWMRSLSR